MRVLFSAGMVPGDTEWWLPVDAAAHGVGLDRHLALNLWIAAGLLVAVHLLVGMGLWLRRAPGAKKPVHGRANALLFECGAVVVMTGVFGWLGVRAERLWAAARYTGGDPAALQVEATGMQFAWYFRYPGRDFAFGRTRAELVAPGEGNPVGIDPADEKGMDDFVAGELVLPVGREVDLRLRAVDVIHGFSVPELRVKQNAVPGETFHVHFTTTRVGRYAIVCTQLCGLGHYRMGATLRVVTLSEFERWRDEKEAAK